MTKALIVAALVCLVLAVIGLGSFAWLPLGLAFYVSSKLVN